MIRISTVHFLKFYRDAGTKRKEETTDKKRKITMKQFCCHQVRSQKYISRLTSEKETQMQEATRLEVK